MRPSHPQGTAAPPRRPPSATVRGALAAIITIATIAACYPASVDVLPLAAVPYPERAPTHPVRIYVGGAPAGPNAELAELRVTDDGAYPLWSEATANAIRLKVRRLGGDAVVALREVVEEGDVVVTRTASEESEEEHKPDSTTTSTRTVGEKTAVGRQRVRYLVGTVVRYGDGGCADGR